MKGRLSRKGWISIAATAVLLALALAVGTTLVQGPDGDPEAALAGGPSEVHAFSYQGRFLDGGVPANGFYDFIVDLYDSETVGTYVAPCTDVGTGSLSNLYVQDGMFNLYLLCGDWNSDVFTGGSRWIQVQVRPHNSGGYTTLPRQPISPTPYAWSVVPGAVVYGAVASPSAVISVTQTYGDPWSSTGGYGIYGYAPRSGVYGRGGLYGVDAFGNYAAVRGQGGLTGVSGGGNKYGLYGYVNTSTALNPSYGVYGYNGSTATAGAGVYGYARSSPGGKFVSYNGNLIEGWEDALGNGSPDNLRFKVTWSGQVYADGTYNTPAADFAEMLPAADGLEPGDVLAVGPDGQLVRSSVAYQPTVVGVYSTQPGFLGGAGADADLEGQVPLAVVGLVPVKASAENGPIQPGDLLVASSTPGHCMRAGDDPAVGTVIGKALEGLDTGTGLIQMLVTLQ